jgi:hypothetical protein
MVDAVIADVGVDSSIKDFVSVELQAVDLTGSVYPAFDALINNQECAKPPTFGVNWANVKKRYINQLIHKGFFHHHWGSRIVSIIQTPLYDYFRSSLQFDELDPRSPNANVVFMAYDFIPGEALGAAANSLRLAKAVGTSHNSLMLSAIYKTPPSRDVFCKKVIERF